MHVTHDGRLHLETLNPPTSFNSFLPDFVTSIILNGTAKNYS